MPAKPEMLLWLSDARGQYIPRDFAHSFENRIANVRGVEQEVWKILEAGPRHDYYWDAWTDVCDSAVVTDEKGVEYFVWQDGDCWLVPKGMEYSEANDTWEWPSEDEE